MKLTFDGVTIEGNPEELERFIGNDKGDSGSFWWENIPYASETLGVVMVVDMNGRDIAIAFLNALREFAGGYVNGEALENLLSRSTTYRAMLHELLRRLDYDEGME